MNLFRRLGALWRKSVGGIYVPVGHISDFSAHSARTYLQLKERGEHIARIYAECGVRLSQSSELAKLISDAAALSDAWLSNEPQPKDVLLRAAVLDRVAEVVLLLESEAGRAAYLRKLLDGNLDLLSADRSLAKDTLWELELWASYKARGLDAQLTDPPDIVLSIAGQELAVACKKIHSEAALQKRLSEAVRQVESGYRFGIAAINLDSLFPGGPLKRFENERAATAEIDRFNREFVRRQERHFRKYLDGRRLMAAWVSSTVLTDLVRERQRLNNFRHATVWVVPGLAPDQQAVFDAFYSAYFPGQQMSQGHLTA